MPVVVCSSSMSVRAVAEARRGVGANSICALRIEVISIVMSEDKTDEDAQLVIYIYKHMANDKSAAAG